MQFCTVLTEHYGFEEQMEAQLDPITDIFRTLHVTAFGQHRLEATAPWGLIQEKQIEEKITPSDKKVSAKDLARFAMLRAATAGSVSKAFRSRFPSPVVIAFCWLGGLRLFCAIAREHVQGQPSARSPLKPTAMSLITEAAAPQRQSYAAPSVSTEPASGPSRSYYRASF